MNTRSRAARGNTPATSGEVAGPSGPEDPLAAPPEYRVTADVGDGASQATGNSASNPEVVPAPPSQVDEREESRSATPTHREAVSDTNV